MEWPYSFLASENSSLTDGVLQYCMRAWHSTALFKNHSVHTAIIIIIIIITSTSDLKPSTAISNELPAQ